MKRFSFLLLVVLFFYPALIFAAYFTPVDGAYGSEFTPEYIATVVEQMQEVVDLYNSDKKVLLAGNQDKFAEANNNASSSTMLNGSLYTRTDIETVAIGLGTATGIVNPGAVSTITDDLNNGKDVNAGAAINGFALYASVDGNSFPVDILRKILFDFKIGYFSNSSIVEDFNFDSFMIGGGIRYKVFRPQVSSPSVVFRPITIGTGVYHVNSSMTFFVDSLYKDITDQVTGIRTQVETDLEFVIANSSTTIPLEIVSSVQFFNTINLIAGTGCDFVFGSTDVELTADSDIKVSHSLLPVAPIEAPDLKLHDSVTTENAQFLRYKIIGGLGVQIASATLDMPVVYYPMDNGFTVSLIAGAAF
ncbi:MAG: hypothetical protein PF637_00250 [Spirochaetes bacterium]|jgi:hypothetical protein|nr:hypothetical protein [Spirochaetota bacterium]